jgi:hypothetical protein
LDTFCTYNNLYSSCSTAFPFSFRGDRLYAVDHTWERSTLRWLHVRLSHAGRFYDGFKMKLLPSSIVVLIVARRSAGASARW